MAILGKSKREALTEFRRAEILAAARKVFAQKGYREATLDDVAAAAEIAKGTLYLYFSSKDDIFAAAVLGSIEELLEQSRVVIDQALTTEQKLRAAIHVRFDFFRRNQQFLKIYFTEFASMCTHPGHLRGQFRDAYARMARALEPVIREGVRNGSLRRVPPLETAMALIELVRMTIALHLLGMYEHEFDLEEFVFDLFWKGIQAEGRRNGGSSAKTLARRVTQDEVLSSRR